MEITAAMLSAIGAGLVTFGAGLGISKVAVAALESAARQPELQAKLQTMMIIAAALIEGVALFCAVICIIAVGK
jgi:F-type H+-transporting ATPase subunit c